MEEIWQRIESWLKTHAPDILGDLANGATKEELDQTAKELGVELPADFRAAYQIHNGQEGNEKPVLGSWELYPLSLIVSQWQDEKDLFDEGEFKDADKTVRPKGPVRKEWWNPHWIPVAGNSSGDYYCLDLAPADGGHKGQIINFWHADENREVLASSFKGLLEDYAKKLEGNEYTLNDRGRIVTRKEADK